MPSDAYGLLWGCSDALELDKHLHGLRLSRLCSKTHSCTGLIPSASLHVPDHESPKPPVTDSLAHRAAATAIGSSVQVCGTTIPASVMNLSPAALLRSMMTGHMLESTAGQSDIHAACRERGGTSSRSSHIGCGLPLTLIKFELLRAPGLQHTHLLRQHARAMPAQSVCVQALSLSVCTHLRWLHLLALLPCLSCSTPAQTAIACGMSSARMSVWASVRSPCGLYSSACKQLIIDVHGCFWTDTLLVLTLRAIEWKYRL